MSLFYISLSYIENHKNHETLSASLMGNYFYIAQLKFIDGILTFA
jgi:hypothetical protein